MHTKNIQILLAFGLKIPVRRNALLVQVKALHRKDHKVLPESMVIQFTYAYMRLIGVVGHIVSPSTLEQDG